MSDSKDKKLSEIKDDMADINLNYEILSDSYFTGRCSTGDVIVFRSSVFPDIGWNYGVLMANGRILADDELSYIRNNSDASPPAFVVIDQQLKALKDQDAVAASGFSEHSVWMSCNILQKKIEADHEIRIFEPRSASIVNDAVDVFEASYCGEGVGSIGYSQLGPEYPIGFRRMLTHCERSHLVASFVDSKLIAIASVVFHPNMALAGIYNVGVEPDFRGRRIGASISWEATKFAFDQGSKRCILQTEADSEVEAMYRHLGYSRDFVTYYSDI